MRWYRKLCLKTTLGASNVLVFGGAIGLLVAGSRVRKGGWLDVFEDNYAWFHTLYVLIVVSLSVLIATQAISGLYSVIFRRKKWVLLVYAATTLLTFAFCLFLAIEGSISLSTAHSWKSRQAIDTMKEAHVEASFNQVYCVSQAAYLCTASSNSQWLVRFGSDDLRDLYLDPLVSTKVKQAMATERLAGARSLLELCEDESSPLHYPVLETSIATLCSWCGDIADLHTYVHLIAWANTKCPPSRPSAAFCVDMVWQNYSNPQSTAPSLDSFDGVFMNGPSTSGLQFPSGIPGVAPVPPLARNPPYAMCRKIFLSYWSYFSQWFLALSLVLLAFLVVVIRVAWLVLREKPDRYNARHGREPERKPLVQLASRPPTTTRAAKPRGAMATAKAKARALFSHTKTSK